LIARFEIIKPRRPGERMTESGERDKTAKRLLLWLLLLLLVLAPPLIAVLLFMSL
jgi:hypothetical protein